MLVDIRTWLVDGCDRPGDGREAREVPVLDEMVLTEPDQVETESVEEGDLLDGLGINVLQGVVTARRAPKVVSDAETETRHRHRPTPGVLATGWAFQYVRTAAHLSVPRAQVAFPSGGHVPAASWPGVGTPRRGLMSEFSGVGFRLAR